MIMSGKCEANTPTLSSEKTSSQNTMEDTQIRAQVLIMKCQEKMGVKECSECHIYEYCGLIKGYY